VNRGLYGVETASLLLALKVAFPERIHLLRGSHETRQITEIYGFKDECLRKYGDGGGEEVWQAFMNTFDALPVAAIINDKTLCLHSGLSPSLDTIAQIEELDRYFVIKLLVQYSCTCACVFACAFVWVWAWACAADSLQPFVGRFQDIPPEGPLTDLAWNQPEDVEGWQIPPRAAGFLFGSGTVAMCLTVW
jgi:serine/threonine-protein phosphatase 2A catalytic subunit